MKRLIFTLFIVTCISAFNVINAQEERSGDDRWERFRAEKVSYFTDKLEITPTEAQKFWPIYNELEKKRGEIQGLRRELEMKIYNSEKSLSEKEATQLTKDYTKSFEKEAELNIKYNENLLEILSPKKVLKLYRVENEFRMHLIRKFRDRGNRGERNQ